MNREKFEALPEIKSRLVSVKFNEKLDRYESRSPVIIECFEAALWLNGAYYAFCEQEKRIEVLVKHLNRANGLILDDLEDLLK